jgi:very-short-patch-repair endonuclease
LASVESYEPKNNFRVDFGFWDGQQLIAVEIDGAEPEGYAKDIRRDRLLRRAGVDVIHILNLELERHKGRALDELLPAKFFGHGWNFEGFKPHFDLDDGIPF